MVINTYKAFNRRTGYSPMNRCG